MKFKLQDFVNMSGIDRRTLEEIAKGEREDAESLQHRTSGHAGIPGKVSFATILTFPSGRLVAVISYMNHEDDHQALKEFKIHCKVDDLRAVLCLPKPEPIGAEPPPQYVQDMPW